MATSKDPKDPKDNAQPPQARGFAFKKVTTQPQTTTRLKEGGTVFPSGLLCLNTNGSAAWRKVWKQQGFEETKYAVIYGANLEAGLAAAYAVTTGTPKATGVSQVGKDKRLYNLHLGGVFEEHEEMRPAGKKKVAVSVGPDADGVVTLIVHLQTSLPKRSTSRDSGENEDTAAATAAKDTKKRTTRKGNAETNKPDTAPPENPPA